MTRDAVAVRSRHGLVAEALRGRITQVSARSARRCRARAGCVRSSRSPGGPVRQALATLRNEGLFELSQGKPAVVRGRDARQTLDTFTPFSQWARWSGRVAGSRTLEIAKRRPREDAAIALKTGPDDLVVEVLRVRLDGEPTMIERSTS